MQAIANIPKTDHEALMQLTDDQRREVLMWSRLVSEIDRERSKSAAFQALAARYSGVRGMSCANIRTKYYAFKRQGWRALVNGSRLKADQRVRVIGDAPKGQPPLFVEFWKGLQESFQRSSSAAYRELLTRYRRGDDIPGIGTWRTVWMDVLGGLPPNQIPINAPLPEGWSERNLKRYKPSRTELAFMRGGLSEARKLLPKIYTTRAGMQPGQIYVFDDMWHDLLVNAPGNSKAMRPLEFACQDVFSAARVAWGIQPMRENPDTGKREMLRETEMRFLLAHVLCTIGFNKEGCRLHVEHGTAAIRTELEEFLFEVTGGAITVARGGIHNTAAFDGAFAPQARGNSRFKSTLESQHSLVHNELAGLPGAVGKDRDHAPEQIHGLQVYNTKLLAKAAALPPDRAALLQMPVLSIDQFRSIVAEAYERINLRTDHNLEGWEQAGLVTNEYRLSLASAWEPMTRLLTMDPDERELAEALIFKRPDKFAQTRKLSPAEAFARGGKQLVRLPHAYAPEIIGSRNAKPVRLDGDHFISFQDRRIGPGIHRYHAVAETSSGTVRLQEDRTYLIYATPFDASAIFVCDADNRYIGLARAVQTACKTDTESIHRQIGKLRHEEAELLGTVKARHADKSAAMRDMKAHNNAVLRGDPVTEDELAENSRIRESSRSIADCYSEADEDAEPAYAAPTPRSKTRSFSEMYRDED